MRLRLVVFAALGVVLAALYLAWVRDLPVFAVERVKIDGLPKIERSEVREKLRRAGRDMTRLHVSKDRLLDAVADHPTVGDLRAHADLGGTLYVEVTPHDPVAKTRKDGRWTAVGASGETIDGLHTHGLGLPQLDVAGDEGAAAARAAAARLVATAPRELRGRIDRVDVQGRRNRAFVVDLNRNVTVSLGDARQTADKWAAARRLLEEPGASEEAKVDVQVPSRPALVDLRQDATEPSIEEESAATQGTPDPQVTSGSPTG